MKKILAATFLSAMAVTAVNAQVSARYFLSTQGLSNPASTESAAIAVAAAQAMVNAGDGSINTGGANTAQRLYLWAMIPGSPATDLKGFDLSFHTTGDVRITQTNIWQNTNSIPDPEGGPDPIEVYRRWESDVSFPGSQNWANVQDVDLTPAVAVLTDGITNNASRSDDQRRTVTFNAVSSRAVVVGWLEVNGSVGDVQIINTASGFLQGTGANNRVFLGLDDAAGAAAEIVGTPYNNASPEFSFVPEPASLALLALGALGLRRR